MQKKADLVFSVLVLLLMLWMFWEGRNWAFRARLFPWTIGVVAIALAAIQVSFALRKVSAASNGRNRADRAAQSAVATYVRVEEPGAVIEAATIEAAPLGTEDVPARGEAASVIGAAVESAYGEGSAVAEEEVAPEVSRRRSLEMSAWIFAFAITIVLFGFTLGAVVATVAFLRLASRERWSTIIPIALATYLFFYVIFDKLLNIPFPNGMVADALGMEAFDSYIADPIWRLVTRR